MPVALACAAANARSCWSSISRIWLRRERTVVSQFRLLRAMVRCCWLSVTYGRQSRVGVGLGVGVMRETCAEMVLVSMWQEYNTDTDSGMMAECRASKHLVILQSALQGAYAVLLLVQQLPLLLKKFAHPPNLCITPLNKPRQGRVFLYQGMLAKVHAHWHMFSDRESLHTSKHVHSWSSKPQVVGHHAPFPHPQFYVCPVFG